jgi:hypothetical protein
MFRPDNDPLGGFVGMLGQNPSFQGGSLLRQALAGKPEFLRPFHSAFPSIV